MTGEHDDLIAEAKAHADSLGRSTAHSTANPTAVVLRRLMDALEAAEQKADLGWRMYRDAAAQLSKDQAELERVTHERDELRDALAAVVHAGSSQAWGAARSLLAEKEHT